MTTDMRFADKTMADMALMYLALEAELAEAKKLHEDYRKFMAGAEQDVRRYRWLRKRGISLTGSTRGWRSDEYLDKHIDAAIDQATRERE